MDQLRGEAVIGKQITIFLSKEIENLLERKFRILDPLKNKNEVEIAIQLIDNLKSLKKS